MSIFNNITLDIVNTLNNASITYGGETKTIVCEQERMVNIIGGRSPLIKISGPIGEVLHRVHLRAHWNLNYLIEFIDDSINDEYNPDTSVNEITNVTGNVAGDLIKLLMVDRKRGGNAFNTEPSGFGYYFDYDGDTPLFIVYLQLEIQANVIDTDPYLTGG